MDKHVAFVGAGAMGCYVGGRMAGAGIDVTVIDPWGQHIDTIKRQGLALGGTQGSATVRVNALHVHEVQSVVRRPVDVAFVLKTIPCLEQVDKRIGSSLLDILGAKQLVVSFPIQSLGGKRKGMLQHYSAHFAELMAGRPWPVQRLEFESELVFIVKKMADVR